MNTLAKRVPVLRVAHLILKTVTISISVFVTFAFIHLAFILSVTGGEDEGWIREATNSDWALLTLYYFAEIFVASILLSSLFYLILRLIYGWRGHRSQRSKWPFRIALTCFAALTLTNIIVNFMYFVVKPSF